MLKPNGHGFFHLYAIYLVIILFDMNSSSYATSCSILVSLNSLCIPMVYVNAFKIWNHFSEKITQF